MKLIIAILCAILTVNSAYSQVIGSGTVMGNSTASPRTPTQSTMTGMLDRAFCNTNGQIIQRGASVWACASVPGTPAPCGWRENMVMSPGDVTGANTTTFKTLTGPAYFLPCGGVSWITSPSTITAATAALVTTVGQGGTGNGTGLVSINVTSRVGNGCTSPCVSVVTAQGGLDPSDPAGTTLQPNKLYNIYLVARDGSFAPNDWGLVFSSRSCNNGPSGTVQAVYPYYTCIDWFWSNGAANAMECQTVKQDHWWNFAGSTAAYPLLVTAGTAVRWTGISGLTGPTVSNCLSDSTGTVMLLTDAVSTGATVQIAPNAITTVTFGPGSTGIDNTHHIYSQVTVTTDRGPPAWFSNDTSGAVYLFGGLDGF